jgi:hypothetical protein
MEKRIGGGTFICSRCHWEIFLLVEPEQPPADMLCAECRWIMTLPEAFRAEADRLMGRTIEPESDQRQQSGGA